MPSNWNRVLNCVCILIPVMSVALLCILPDTCRFHELLCAQFNHDFGFSSTCTVALLSPLFQFVIKCIYYFYIFLFSFFYVKFTFIYVSLVSYCLSIGRYIRVRNISVMYFWDTEFISLPRVWLSWLRCLRALLSLSNLILGHNHFLLRTFRYIIH